MKTGAYTAAAGDIVPCDVTSAGFTVTLPTAPADKTQVAVKRVLPTTVTANLVTIACGGSATINRTGGVTSTTLTLAGQSSVFQYDTASTTWTIIAVDLPLSQLDARYPAGGTASVVTKTAPYTITSADDVVLADATGTPVPTALAVTASGSGGTFPAGTNYWTVTATPPGGVESVSSNEVSAAIAANGSAALAWTAATGSTTGWVYKVYRGLMSGQQATTPPLAGLPNGLVATLGNVTSYTDTGTALSAAVAPIGGFALTLPTAVGATKPIDVKAIHSTPYLVTILPNGAQTIEGQASITIGPAVSGAAYKSVRLASDGTNWKVI